MMWTQFVECLSFAKTRSRTDMAVVQVVDLDRCRSPSTITWSRPSRRMDPISLSA